MCFHAEYLLTKGSRHKLIKKIIEVNKVVNLIAIMASLL